MSSGFSGRAWQEQEVLERELDDRYGWAPLEPWEEEFYAHGPEVDEFHIAGQVPAELLEVLPDEDERRAA